MSDKKKLVIQPQKYTGETSVISMRLPKSMLAEVDEIASKTGRTRNEILLLSMEFALEHLTIEDKGE